MFHYEATEDDLRDMGEYYGDQPDELYILHHCSCIDMPEPTRWYGGLQDFYPDFYPAPAQLPF